MRITEGLITKLSEMSIGRACVIGVLSAAVYWVALYDDGESVEQKINHSENELKRLSSLAEKAKALQNNQDVLRREVTDLNENFKRALKKLPRDLNVSKVLDSVNAMAKVAGVRVIALRPQQKITRDLYEEMTMGIELQGKFSELTLFLMYVSKLPRVIRLSGFKIESPRDIGGASSKLVLRGYLTAYKYLGSIGEQKK